MHTHSQRHAALFTSHSCSLIPNDINLCITPYYHFYVLGYSHSFKRAPPSLFLPLIRNNATIIYYNNLLFIYSYIHSYNHYPTHSFIDMFLQKFSKVDVRLTAELQVVAVMERSLCWVNAILLAGTPLPSPSLSMSMSSTSNSALALASLHSPSPFPSPSLLPSPSPFPSRYSDPRSNLSLPHNRISENIYSSELHHIYLLYWNSWRKLLS